MADPRRKTPRNDTNGFNQGGDMLRMGMGELVMVFFVVLLLFGGKRLPEIAQAMGKALREFKKSTQEVKNTINGIKRDVEIL